MLLSRLVSPRLAMRPFTMGDVYAVHRYASDPKVCRHMNWGPNEYAETQAFVARAVAALAAEPVLNYEMAVTLRHAGTVIGGAVLRLPAADSHQAEIGYCLNAEWWEQGFASEVAQRLVDFGLTTLGLHRLWARCRPENGASMRVLEKAGMSFEGLLKHDECCKGRYHDVVRFGIVAG